jgi:glutamate/tyrosine decarboxylase-like PLP-dependent enzyme
VETNRSATVQELVQYSGCAAVQIPDKGRIMNPNLLFPSSSACRLIDDELTRALSESRDRVNRGSVVPTFDWSTFADQLDAFDFETPIGLDRMLTWTIMQMETGLVHVVHPRYFGLFNPTPTFPALCADRVVSVFNPQLATSTTSPAAVAIEAHVIRLMARRIGLPPDSTGHFTTGGTEANYTALLLALNRACPDFASDGARAFKGRPTFYISRDSHLAWVKIAVQAGVGRSSVRLVATDGAGRLDMNALSEALDADIAEGHQPVMIVATAGTTNAGMIDPIGACAAAAKAMDIWLHVDAAWGGAAVASETHRQHLKDIEQADSITVDAHKWFAVTMGCGMLLTCWPALLSSIFQVSTGYMPSNRAVDPYVTSAQWSRRFLGLRLFLSLAVAGWRGYGYHVERTLQLGERLKERLAVCGWRVINQSPLGVVCIEPPYAKDAREIVDNVLATGKAWVSVASFEGREVIRACVVSGETTENDIADLVDCLEQAAWTL